MPALKQIVDHYIGEARANPGKRPEIFRHAAYEFMGMAQNPKNARGAAALATIGINFADAAAKAMHDRPPTMDDFHDLLQETVTAYNQVGDDHMDLIARRREIHDERTPITPGFVSIAPESFNKDATLGRSAKVAFLPAFPPDEQAALIRDEGIQTSQNVAFWQGTKKESQAMTVDVSLGFLPPLPFGFEDANPLLRPNVRPFGEVEYGADGNRTKIIFDLSFGTRLTVVGNYIAVTVGVNPPMFFGTPGARPTVPITCGASIGTFAAPSQAPLIYTAYVDDADTNTGSGFGPGTKSALIPIPLKAVQLLPIQTNLTLAPNGAGGLGETLALVFYDYGGNIITDVYYRQVFNEAIQPIPIYGDAAFIRVFNPNTNVTFAQVRLPFQLAM